MLPYDDEQSPLERFLRKLTAPLRWISEAVGTVVWACERAIAFTVGFLLTGTESVDRAGDLLHGTLYLLVWPFVAMGRGANWIWDRATPPIVRQGIETAASGLARLWHLVLHGFFLVAETLVLDRVFWFFAWLLQPIWRPIGAMFMFGVAWAQSREYRAILWSIPALIIVVPLGAAITHGLVKGPARTADVYRRAARSAREAGDQEMLQFYERKLAQLDVENRAAEFRTALAMAEQGDLEGALVRMQTLAPDDETGYVRAHYWLVQQLMGGTLDMPRDESLRRLRIHLDHLASLGYKGPELSLIEAIWFIETGDLPSAADALAGLTEGNRRAATQRLLINIKLDRLDDARADALVVRRHMELALEQDTELSDAEYQSWAIAEQLQRDAPRYRAVLDRWHKEHPENQRVREEIAKLTLRQFNQTLDTSLKGSDGLLGSLAQADAKRLSALFLQSYQLHMEQADQLNDQLRRICHLSAKFPIAGDFLQMLAADQRTPASFLVTIGSYAIQSGDWAGGAALLERAAQQDPNLAMAWNNIAWVRANQQQPDLEAALRAANRAIELAADEARYRETRGQIFIQLERWPEAVEDLEFAANGMPEAEDIHRSLAKAYQVLGNEDLAQIHLEYLK